MDWFRERHDLLVLNRLREAFKNQYYGSIEIWRLLGANVTLNYWEKSTFKKKKKAPIIYCLYFLFFSDFVRFFKFRNFNTKILIDDNSLFVEALTNDARISGFWLPIVKNYAIGKAVIVTERIEIYNQYSPLYSVHLLKSFSFLEWVRSRAFIFIFLVKNFKFLFFNKKEFHPISPIELLNIIIIQINTAVKFKWSVDKYKPKGFLTVWDWYDFGSVGTAVFKTKGLPTFTFIHGAAGKESLKEFVPLNADYILAWGKHNTKSLLELGVRKEQILEVGCPRIKLVKHAQNKKARPEKITILLTGVLDPCFVDDILQIVNDFGNEYKILIRLHPSLNLDCLDLRIKSLDVNFVTSKDESIEDSITNTDFIILDTSTAGFDAVCLNKPVFVLDSAPVKRPQDIMGDILIYNAAIFCPSFDVFKVCFNKYISNSNIRAKLSKDMILFKNDFISYFGDDSASQIFKQIESNSERN